MYDGSLKFNTLIDTKGFVAGTKTVNSSVGGMTKSMSILGKAITAAFAIGIVIKFAKSTIDASNQVQNAMIGLKSVVEGTGGSFSRANEFIQDYIKDGLVPLANAATAYKNLAARGYDEEQIINVMTRLKDSAAFGRQASLQLGESIQGATEGLKNENSILVDNAGVTKNVSVMWSEYAKSIGVGVNSLTTQQKIQAEVNGIMNETRFQIGDAAKLEDTFSGKTAKLSKTFFDLKVAVGDLVKYLIGWLIPVLTKVAEGFTIMITGLNNLLNIEPSTDLTSSTEDLAESAVEATEAETGLADGITSAGTAADKFLASFDEIEKLQSDIGSSSGISSAFDGITIGEPSGIGGVGELKEAINGLDIGEIKVPVWLEAMPPVPPVAEILEQAALTIPNPVFNPNWGLTPPKVPVPELPTIPNPIFNPTWGLADTLKTELGLILTDTNTTFALLKLVILNTLSAVKPIYETSLQEMATSTETSMSNIKENISTAFSTAGSNIGTFVNTSIASMNTWSTSVQTAVYNTSKNTMSNIATMCSNSYSNIATFINTSTKSFAAWGNSLMESVYQTATNMRNSFLNGLSSMWENYVSFTNLIGEKVVGFFKENKTAIIKGVTIAAVGAAVAGAIVLSGGSLAAVAGSVAASGGLAAMPAFANGAVVPPNREFAAILGDNKRETEIVSPLSTMKQAVAEVMSEIGGSQKTVEEHYILNETELMRIMYKLVQGGEQLKGTSLRTV